MPDFKPDFNLDPKLEKDSFLSDVFDEIQISIASGGYNLDSLQFSQAIPEPGSLAVFGLGLIGLGALRRRKLA